ncbi:MAG: hypothetical protein IT539_04215 [Bradyrhizobiaceae bacterium]|nr:hypothetical protein [Bradyrhizobiaceae bacterium]
MSDTSGNSIRAQSQSAQSRSLWAIGLAVLGWLAVIGLIWMLVSERAAHREQVARLEQTHGNLEEARARVSAAIAELEKVDKARAQAQSALDAGQKQQADIQKNLDQLTLNRDTLNKEVTRIEQSLAGLTQQASARAKELTATQQELQAARQELEKLRSEVAKEAAKPAGSQ